MWLATMIAKNKRESVMGVKALLLEDMGRRLEEQWANERGYTTSVIRGARAEAASRSSSPGRGARFADTPPARRLPTARHRDGPERRRHGRRGRRAGLAHARAHELAVPRRRRDGDAGPADVLRRRARRCA